MLRYTFILVLFLLVIPGFAQKQKITREEYIQKYYKLAVSEMERSGIPASITLAQGCLEAQNGNSRLALEGNNHFGIKCKTEWKGKKIYHDDDAKGECFRRYAHAEASYIDHSNFLMNSSRYSSLFQLDPRDYVSWAKGLKQAGYATDPTYAERLIKIIEDNRLYVYDQDGEFRLMASVKQEPANAKMSSSALGKTNASHKIELRNGLQSIVVGEGDTYASVSKDLGMKDWELATYNDIEKGKQLRVNEILYIETKYKKNDRKHLQHIAEPGDNMHYISQLYGLRLKPLLKRNRMKATETPAAGQIIYLRNKKPRKE